MSALMTKLRRVFESTRMRFILTLGLLVALLLWGYLLFQDHQSLTTNLFTEALGIGFTIFLIDGILNYRERKRSLPARFAATQQVRAICHQADLLWVNILRDSFDPEADRDLLSDSKISQFDGRLSGVAKKLNLDSRAPVYPSRTWETYLPQATKDIREHCSKALARYSIYLEPSIIKSIHELENSVFFQLTDLLSTISEVNEEKGGTLGIFFSHDQRIFDDFLRPLERLNIEYERIREILDRDMSGSASVPPVGSDFFFAVIQNLNAKTSSRP